MNFGQMLRSTRSPPLCPPVHPVQSPFPPPQTWSLTPTCICPGWRTTTPVTERCPANPDSPGRLHELADALIRACRFSQDGRPVQAASLIVGASVLGVLGSETAWWRFPSAKRLAISAGEPAMHVHRPRPMSWTKGSGVKSI